MAEKTSAFFAKVSWEQFLSDTETCFGRTLPDAEREILHQYFDEMPLPVRSTSCSAGYDFFLPFGSLHMTPYETLKIPTGLSVHMDQGLVLMLYPRSSYGFKYGMRFANTTPIIDSDFSYGKTEGHIIAAVQCSYPFEMNHNDRYMQGILMPYGITCDDEASEQQRTGGIGSTGV